MYRTPVRDRRTGPGGMWGRGGVRITKPNQPPGNETFSTLFQSSFVSGIHQQQAKGTTQL